MSDKKFCVYFHSKINKNYLVYYPNEKRTETLEDKPFDIHNFEMLQKRVNNDTIQQLLE